MAIEDLLSLSEDMFEGFFKIENEIEIARVILQNRETVKNKISNELNIPNR